MLLLLMAHASRVAELVFCIFALTRIHIRKIIDIIHGLVDKRDETV